MFLILVLILFQSEIFCALDKIHIIEFNGGSSGCRYILKNPTDDELNRLNKKETSEVRVCNGRQSSFQTKFSDCRLSSGIYKTVIEKKGIRIAGEAIESYVGRVDSTKSTLYLLENAFFADNLQLILNKKNFVQGANNTVVILGSNLVKQVGLGWLFGVCFDKKTVPLVVEEGIVFSKEEWQSAFERYVDRGVAAQLAQVNEEKFLSEYFLGGVVADIKKFKYADLKWYEKIVSCFDPGYSRLNKLVGNSLRKTIRYSHSFRKNVLCYVALSVGLICGLVLLLKKFSKVWMGRVGQ